MSLSHSSQCSRERTHPTDPAEEATSPFTRVCIMLVAIWWVKGKFTNGAQKFGNCFAQATHKIGPTPVGHHGVDFGQKLEKTTRPFPCAGGQRCVWKAMQSSIHDNTRLNSVSCAHDCTSTLHLRLLTPACYTRGCGIGLPSYI